MESSKLSQPTSPTSPDNSAADANHLPSKTTSSSNESGAMAQIKSTSIETLTHLDETSLCKLIEYCKKNDCYAPLIRNLGRYFSSREYLVQSFQKPHRTHVDEMLQKAPKDLKKLKKEDFRTMEGDMDKDEDSCAEEDDGSPARSHTSVDLISLRRAMTYLLETKASVFDSLNNAMHSLALGLSVDLRMLTQREQIEEIITVFVIIFETVIIGKSDFVEVALPSICKAASYLPVWAQARLVWIWSEHCRDGLRKLLETLQQLISLQVIAGTYNENAYVQDNENIICATKVMKLVYYTSIVCGQLESPKLREEDLDAEADAFNSEDDAFFGYVGSKKSAKNAEFADPLAEELDVNVMDCRKPFIPFEEFYNDPLSDAIEMDNDYLNFKNHQSGTFHYTRTCFQIFISN